MPRHMHDGRLLNCPGCRILVVSAALERAAESLAMTTSILRLAVSSLKDEAGGGEFKPPRPYRMSQDTHDAKVASGKRLAELTKAKWREAGKGTPK
jgi:hypothetical protein